MVRASPKSFGGRFHPVDDVQTEAIKAVCAEAEIAETPLQRAVERVSGFGFEVRIGNLRGGFVVKVGECRQAKCAI